MGENMQVAEAISLLQNLEFAAAKSLCEKLLVLDPKNAQVWHLFGLADAQQGNLEVAVESLKTATTLAPTNANYHFNLALAYNRLGQFEPAEASYREVILQRRGFREAYINLGTLLVQQGRPQEAVAVLEELLKVCKDDSETHYNLANLFSLTDNVEVAIHHYRRSIELSPDFANARENLTRDLLKQGQTQEAQQVLRDWLDHEPSSSMALHMLASLSGENVPDRCDDEYIRQTFDENFSGQFEEQLARLQYRAPELVANALLSLRDSKDGLAILDAGCGTGLCAEKLRPIAKILHGVDLSNAMLKVAEARKIYDVLVEVELTEYLRSHPSEYDCIVSADTLCYFGDLNPVFMATTNCLRGQGLLIFTVELLDVDGKVSYLLQTNGRYCHSERYVRDSLAAAGLRLKSLESATLRMERGEPVLGAVIVAELEP